VTTDTIDKTDPDVLERDTKVYTLATARLNRVDTPANPLATIDHVRSILAEYDDASTFDLNRSSRSSTNSGDNSCVPRRRRRLPHRA
jgi:hypothetical protein